jgi:hypothetical protein
MGKDYTDKQIDDLVEMSNAASRFELFEIGRKGAEKDVEENHFPKAFKIESQAVG